MSKKSLFTLFLFISTFTTVIGCHLNNRNEIEELKRIELKDSLRKDSIRLDSLKKDSIKNAKPKFFTQSPREGLKEALVYYGIKHPEIVYAQAVLETGFFKSGGCTRDHNLFGIMYKGRHARFKHWTESVIAYRDKIQYRYKKGEDYYHFLNRIGYAEDKRYVSKVKGIARREAKKNNNTL